MLYFALLVVVFGSLWPENSVEATNCTIVAKGVSKFPKDFSFGVATSAYQIEGGWNADGKGVSIWDEYTHNHPDRIKDRTNGDNATESYRLFDSDLKALMTLGVNHYRFSIAWTRIFPTGDVHVKNQKGIDYYNSVIDKLLANGIEPMVTMYHWDLPVGIQKFGGFTNSLIIEQFTDYADELFKLFGDRVKIWTTFNEPNQICKPSYGTAEFPPLVKAPGVGDYMCFVNLLKAHGATYRLYRSKYYEKQRGQIGITLSSIFVYPESKDADDTTRGMQYLLGMLAYPIFSKDGDFSPLLLKEIEESSRQEGRTKSRLPSLGDYWKNVVRGSADFLGLNYYTARYIKPAKEAMGESPSMERDFNYEMSTGPNWPAAASSWLYCMPEGLEDILKYVRDNYANVEVKINENGWSDLGGQNDNMRMKYYKSHLQAVLNAINDGCNVTSYSAWSLVDNFEWNQGYTEKFGLFSVNMKSPKKQRVPKKSALYYKKVIAARSVLDIA